VGRTFLSPLLDYLLIGGGLSLLTTGWLFWGGLGADGAASAWYLLFLRWLPIVLLVSNAAHFAASTVRLYAKPGALEQFPFLTRALPLAALLGLTLSVVFAPWIGRHVQALYLSWSPYHYAAQAYGLALLYCYRSGCSLQQAERRLLRAACLAPFLHNLITTPFAGLAWLAPEWVQQPGAAQARAAAGLVLGILSFLLPALWAVRVASAGKAVPVISLLAVLSNSAWWTLLDALSAFVVATVFHGLQYLVIVTVFHVRDRIAEPDNRHGAFAHAAAFYAACLGLGYFLFQVLPYAYVPLGYGLPESMLLATAFINLHHFIVDAYIWSLRDARNYRIVDPLPAR